MRIKTLFIVILASFVSRNTFAGTSVGEIYISIVQPVRTEISQEAAKQLESKMHQLITANGIADTDPNSRFVITVKSNIVARDIIGGAPQRISQKVEFTFLIGDIIVILNRLSDYIDPDDLEIHIYKNGIYIVNYTLISSFNDKKIDIDKNNKKISIIGNKLVISRLKKDELFISGDIYEVKLL